VTYKPGIKSGVWIMEKLAIFGGKKIKTTLFGTGKRFDEAEMKMLGAVGASAGDEVITSPVADMGTLIGILYQNAIPVFADLDPHTHNPDPRSIEDKISDKTKAIVVVHLA
jgi:perosamine synthetase